MKKKKKKKNKKEAKINGSDEERKRNDMTLCDIMRASVYLMLSVV